jgi:cell division protein FtsX
MLVKREKSGEEEEAEKKKGKEKASLARASSSSSSAVVVSVKEPPHWQDVLEKIRAMRRTRWVCKRERERRGDASFVSLTVSVGFSFSLLSSALAQGCACGSPWL